MGTNETPAESNADSHTLRLDGRSPGRDDRPKSSEATTRGRVKKSPAKLSCCESMMASRARRMDQKSARTSSALAAFVCYLVLQFGFEVNCKQLSLPSVATNLRQNSSDTNNLFIQTQSNFSSSAKPRSQPQRHTARSNGNQQVTPTHAADSSLVSVRTKWRQFERSVESQLESQSEQLRSVLGELLNATKGAQPQVSPQCLSALNDLLDSSAEQELWANRMLDSNARLPSGILDGTFTELGNFDECLSVAKPPEVGANPNQIVRGQYCSLSIRPPLPPRPRLHTVCQRLPVALVADQSTSGTRTTVKFLSSISHQFYYAGLRLGLCVPSRCSRQDVQLLLGAYLAKFELIGQVKSCQSSAGTTDSDQAKAHDLIFGFDLSQQCILLAFALLILLTLLGTLLDVDTRDDVTVTKRASALGEPAKSMTGGSSSPNNGLGPIVSQVHPEPGARGRHWHYQVYRIGDVASSVDSIGDQAVGLQQNPLAHLTRATSKQLIAKDDWLFGTRLHDCGHEIPAGGMTTTTTTTTTSTSNHFDASTTDESWIAHLDSELESAQGASESAKRESDSREGQRRTSPIREILCCFSVRRNLHTIGRNMRTGAGGGTRSPNAMSDIKVIHGLRTLTMVWIIFGHTIGLVTPEMMNSLFPLAQMSCSSRLLQAILNATLAVNTFFMISGLVTVISLARKCSSVLPLILGVRSEDRKEMMRRGAEPCCCPRRPAPVSHQGATTVATGGNCQHQQQQLDEELEISSVSSAISSLGSSSGAPSSCNSRSCLSAGDPGGTRLGGATERRAAAAPKLHLNDKQQVQGDKWLPQTCRCRGQRRTSSESSNSCNGRREQKKHTDRWNTRADIFPSDFQPFLWLIMRYLRLTPTYAAVIGLSVVLPALGSGPFWSESIDSMGSTCRQNWWANLLYVNNFVGTDKLCLIHSWYLSNDWQFFTLSLLLLAIYYQSKKLTLVCVFTLSVASTAATFAITVANEFPPTIVTTSPAVAERWTFIHSLYYKPWPHLPSYLVGMIAGYAIVLRSKRAAGPQMSPNWRRLCWLLSLVLAIALLNSVYPWNMGFKVDPLITGIHSATFRTLWAICSAWLVYALVTAPRGLLARLLSWHGLQVTSRLTYCAYLVHPLIIYYHLGSLRERMDSSPYGQFSRFVSTLGLSYMSALLVALLVESPSIQLQQLLVRLVSKSERDKPASSGDDSTGTPDGGLRRAQQADLNASAWTVTSSFGAQMPGAANKSDELDASSRPLRPVPAERPAKRQSTCCLHSAPANDSSENQAPSSADANSIALDTEFQKKLAHAIGKGFKIRSRMANSGGGNQKTLRGQSAQSRRAFHSAKRLTPESTAADEDRLPAVTGVVTCPTPNKRSSDLSTFGKRNCHRKSASESVDVKLAPKVDAILRSLVDLDENGNNLRVRNQNDAPQPNSALVARPTGSQG